MTLADQLNALAGMPVADLRTQWRSLQGTEPPRVRTDLLRHLLGHALQEKAIGGLRSSQGQALRRIAAGKEAVILKPGLRLVRQWNGRTVTVTVLEDGFLWEERTWRSLSAIARAVTGAHWSGPRFFGLVDHG